MVDKVEGKTRLSKEGSLLGKLELGKARSVLGQTGLG